MQLCSDKTQIVKVPDLSLQECSVADLQDFFSHKERKTTCCYALFDWNEKLYLIKWYVETDYVALTCNRHALETRLAARLKLDY